MKLFEYRGKELFDKYGILVPNGKLVNNEKDFSDLNYPFVLKAQVPVGGRGKAACCPFQKEGLSESLWRTVETLSTSE